MKGQKIKELYFGGDYNPDQWDEATIRKDMEYFKKCHINYVALPVFSWAKLEPEEGVYNFEWLDKILDILWENKIYVCLATSTAAQPEWMSKKYPEIMPVDNNGLKRTHGMRNFYCVNSEKYIVCVGRKVVGEKQLHEGDKWIEEFACINIFEEIFNNYNIQVLSDYNTATAEYNFILLFAKEEENQKCMDLALQACGKIQEEVERYLKACMNFGISDISEDEYQANAQYRKAQKACRQCIYLGMNIILKYEDLQYEEQKEFVITQGERMHFMMTLFQESFEKAEEELRQLFAQAPEDGAAVKFAAMDLLFGCMKFPYTCAVDSEIHNKNWNFSVLQDGVKRISQCETTEEVLNCMFNLFGTLIKQNTEGSDERNRKLVQSILSYIEKNYATDISMDDLTEKFHVSRTYISRLLKKYAGKSFLEYLTDVRFKHVEKLIADDRYKQYEIAEMVGYKDFGYYIKVFKKRYGITPNEFRKHI